MSTAGIHREPGFYPMLPYVGCLVVIGATLLMCVTPLIWLEVMTSALDKLHLSAPMGMLAIGGMVLGGFVNLPIYRWQRDDIQLMASSPFPGMLNWVPAIDRTALQTILAVNVGGCMVPLAIAVYELRFVLHESQQAQLTLAIAVLANIAVCYRVARPVSGVGIIMPGFVAPLTAVLVTWLLLGWGDDYSRVRAPIAFIAGVAGPIIGADLLHLSDLRRLSVGVMSIGGAGTFDGIVLSGIVAAFLA